MSPQVNAAQDPIALTGWPAAATASAVPAGAVCIGDPGPMSGSSPVHMLGPVS